MLDRPLAGVLARYQHVGHTPGPVLAACAVAAHAAAAVPNLRHLEYFHDHARVDRLLFDGVLDPAGGALRPDLSRPGMGLELKRADAERYRKET